MRPCDWAVHGLGSLGTPSRIIPAQRRLNRFHLSVKDLLKPASSKMVPFLPGLQALVWLLPVRPGRLTSFPVASGQTDLAVPLGIQAKTLLTDICIVTKMFSLL